MIVLQDSDSTQWVLDYAASVQRQACLDGSRAKRKSVNEMKCLLLDEKMIMGYKKYLTTPQHIVL